MSSWVATDISNPIPAKGVVPRAIERYFQTSLFLLIVTGFATLASTGKLDFLSMTVVSAALLYRGKQLLDGRSVQIPERITSYLGLVYVLVYLADFFFVSQNFVAASVHLLLFGMVTKIFSVQRDRDHIYLAVLAFLEVLSAAILTVDTVFLAAFSVFLLVAVATFISMEMRRSAMAAGNIQRAAIIPAQTRRRFNFRSLDASLSSTSLAIVFGILVFSVALFFAMPRLSGGYLSRLAQQNALVSGFSDNVQLGEIGRIQQSSQVVMHVRIEGGLRIPELRMRGATLGNFDGHQWFNPPHQSEMVDQNSYSGRYDIETRDTTFPRSLTRFAVGDTHRVVKYRVVMEPIGTNVVFLIPAPRFVFADFREATIDFGQSILNTDHDRATNNYNGISDISQPAPEQLRGSVVDYDSSIANKYLQLPAVDPRVKKLADDLAIKQTNAFDKAAAINAYLSNTFGYTLELPTERQRDPIANFLLVRKKGHCEYFASAMTVMLRVEGIPSRIVTGFRGGEFNDLTGDYIVRARDAHSWVEVFFPGRGWVAFDPTPAGAEPTISAWTRLMLYGDAAREFWREWVINYDFSHQRTLTETAASTSRDRIDRARIWFRAKYEHLLELARKTHRQVTRSPYEFSRSALLLICGILVLLNLQRVRRAIRARQLAVNPGREPRGAATLWYERLIRTLSRKGYPKKLAQTPHEFVASIPEVELRQRVDTFTTHYERARYGNSAEDATRLPELFKEVAKTK